jgi:ABC-type transport system involved in multi-copper enzyme maturation permease subunit
MLQLIKIEWLKIRKYPAFWWLFGIVALTYPFVNMMFHGAYSSITRSNDKMVGQMAKMLLGNPFSFPEAWHSVAYFSSWFVMIPAILVIMLVNNEYTYKTHRQNIIDGWSRDQFISSKLIDVLIISLVATIMYILVAVVYALYTDSSTADNWLDQIQYIPLFLLQTFAQLSIAFLLGFFIRKAFLALGIFLIYSLIIENLLLGLFKWKDIPLGPYLPLEISDKLIPPPAFFGKFGPDAANMYNKAVSDIPLHIGLTCLLTGGIWYLCYTVHRKKDI